MDRPDDVLVSSLRDEIVKINLDRAKRLQDLVALRDMVAATEEERSQLKAQREIHLRDNETLTRELLAERTRIDEIEQDRAQRLKDNQTLSALIGRLQDEVRMLKDDLDRRVGG